MENYIKLLGSGETVSYSMSQLRVDNPQVSFPKNISDATLAEYDVYPLTLTEHPTVSDTQTYDEGVPDLVDGVWTQVWTIRDKTPEELTKDIKRKKDAIKVRRDEAINAGTLVNGMVVATDDLSQQRITGAALAATVDASTTVRWKLPDDTFVTLTAAQIIDLAQAVRTHIQACFDRESELLAALEAGQSYDIDAGWPS